MQSKMNSINILFLIFISFELICLSMSQLNGRCGYPGKPYRAKLEPDNKLQYEEGEEVTYQCTDFWSHIEARRCEKGKWTGKQPRCGDFVDGLLMKDSKMEDISDPNNPKLIFEHLNMNITNTTWRYPNVFTSNRFKKARLRVYDTKKYKWSFKFTAPIIKLFVRINFNFINYTFLTQEMKDNFTFIVSVEVSPYRNCQLIHQSDDIWRENGRKTDTDFICDSISPDAHKQDLQNPSNYMIMYTQSSIDIDHELIAVFFGKSYGSEEDPLCGEPEIKISQVSRFNIQYKDYILDCKSDRYKYISPKNEKMPETSIHTIKCGPDMKWEDSWPSCAPKNPCPLNNLLVGPNVNKTIISSFEGLFYFNDTVYYAVEGTEVLYGCQDPNDILVGKDKRTCNKMGKWPGTEPSCYNPTLSAKSSVGVLVGVLIGVLLFVICLVIMLFFVYTKRMRNRINKQIEKHNRPQSEKFDDYDDIDINGKVYSDTYETIGDDEVRYADPYYGQNSYCPQQDYVEMPKTNLNQTTDGYWRIPYAITVEPQYLEMTCSNKNSPSPSPQMTPKNEGLYDDKL